MLYATLRSGDLAIIDGLICHKSVSVDALMTSRGASILWLSDFSPIECIFSKLKNPTLETLIEAITQGLSTISELDTID